MLNISDMRDWSDVTIAVLRNHISPYTRSNVSVEIDYTKDVEPFPNAPFLFSIGGKLIRNGASVDTREEVQCIEKISDTEFVVNRDPLGSGTAPIEHNIGDPVSFVLMGGSIKSTDKKVDEIINQLLHIEEIIGTVVGEQSILPCFKKQYNESGGYFKVSIEDSQEEEKILRISPGIVVIKLLSGGTKILTVSPEKDVWGVSVFSVKREDFEDKTEMYVYINNEGYVEKNFSLDNVYVDDNSIKYTLSTLKVIDIEYSFTIDIEDTRPEIML